MIPSRRAQSLLRSSIAAALSASLTLTPVATFAGEPPSPQVQYRKAYQAMQQSQWPEAHRLLTALWDKAQTYDVAEALGHVEYRLGHLAASARYFAFAVENSPPNDSAKNARAREDKLEAAKKLVGTVMLKVDPDGATVTVDGQQLPTSEVRRPLFLEPGSHTLSAAAPGQVAITKQLEVAAGQSYSVELALPEPPSAGPAVGSSASTTGPLRSDLAPVVADPSSSEDRRNYVPPGVAAGVGGVALLGSVAFFVAGGAKGSERDDLSRGWTDANACGGTSPPSKCRRISELADQASLYRTLGYASLGTCVAAGIFTYLLWPRQRDAQTNALLLPSVGGSSRDFTVGAMGHF